MSKDKKETSIEAEIETTEESVEQKEEDNISEVEKLKEKIAELEDKYIRTHASFENSKRLLAKDKATAVAYANESFAKDILTVIDSLDSALSMIDNVDESDTKEFLKKMKEGLKLVDEQLHKVLEKHDIKNIDCTKEYDPNLHQAIMQVESDKHKSGQIVQVMQKGYTIKDRVLRPAMVTTAK
ncbi:MAG: nucleotide exchange factor GrpE [Epsilonproteobacteria bacterium]|nr:nucleotide exchange factor GrpE [Campylobacterota bacterium]